MKDNEQKEEVYKKRSFGFSTVSLLLIILIIICWLQGLSFALIGDPQTILEVGEDYLEKGAISSIGNKNTSDSIIIDSSNVDTSTPGRYEVIYYVTNQYGNNTTIIREVIVVDTKPPELVLRGNDPFYIIEGDAYTEPGSYAVDNVDGDISNRITILRIC